jgi:hypothetical protein
MSILFRELDATERREFRESARENYTAGDPIDRDLWHPIYVAECEAINFCKSGYFTNQ